MKKILQFNEAGLKLLLCYLILFFLPSCGKPEKNVQRRDFQVVQGKCMGTTYSVKYFDPDSRDFSEAIDSILFVLDKKALSTYSDSSTIGIFNWKKKLVLDTLDAVMVHFLENMLISRQVFEKSRGAFDPTVMPLVNYWGFGFRERETENRDTSRIASILQFVGMKSLRDSSRNNEVFIWTEHDSLMLDFSAIAKGYSTEVVANFLQSKNIRDYYIEVGGELALGGKNPSGTKWVIGVNQPTMDSEITEIYQTLQLTDCFVASSGNYRNYYKIGDQIISHTINPKTGFPERNNILSTTVISNKGAKADAWATAGMVIGWPYFLDIIQNEPDIEAYIIYSDEKGMLKDTATSGAKVFLLP